MSENQSTPYNNNLFSNHFLENRVQELDEWKEAEIEDKFEELQQTYELHKPILDGLGESETQNKIINKFFKALGHSFVEEQSKRVSGKLLNPDYLMLDNGETEAEIRQDEDRTLFDEAYAVADAKKWDTKLDRSSTNHTNPAFQIYNYVDRLRIRWGILTNGKKWRLYAYEDAEADTYYEIDIVEQIFEKDDREEALENFKYFYLFFQQQSFLPREEGFVDKVFKGSVSYAKGLEESLEDDIYDALEITAQGFFETNDIEMTEENIEEVHHSSLILLYRLLFVLNAESRDLLPADNDRYEKKLSLKYLTERLDDDSSDIFSEDTWAWDERINDLFDAIDNGREYGDKFKITAYNGGLFDQEEHEFLANNKLKGTHIKKILKKLAQSKDKETDETALVDYRDLNIRHLGSVYEGLLEHELAEAKENMIVEDGEWTPAEDSKKDFNNVDETDRVKEGQVYITNESGERKATGSYYTPEYVVEYIVENTVGPKVDEKIKEAEDESEVLEKVLELNICDPAMGSGHFLTEATSFIARKVIENGKLEEEDIEEGNEFVWVKRQAVKESIYGVDINPLAVELGKLSLWIETMAKGKPLSFLDHHLKVGNSLVGSDFENIFAHPIKQKKIDNDRFKFGTPEDLKEQFKNQYQEIEEEPEETKEQVHRKEKKYEEFRNSTLYNQVKQLANVHTRQFFKEEADTSDYENFLVNMGAEGTVIESQDWFKSAQQDSKQRNYFHWQIEFPKVFFSEQSGFDAVVGNPPYVIFKALNEDIRDYYRKKFDSFVMKGDIYTLFMELSTKITRKEGHEGYIIQNKFTKANYGEKIREMILETETIQEIIDFNDSPVFEVTTYPMILIREKNQTDENEFLWRNIQQENEQGIKSELSGNKKGWRINQKDLDSDMWSVFTSGNSITSTTIELGEFAEQIGRGSAPGNTDVFLVTDEEIEENDLEKDYIMKVLRGGDVKSYTTEDDDKLSNLIYPYNIDDGTPEVAEESEIPNIIDYLSDHKEKLKERKNYGKRLVDQGYKWYELTYESPGMLNEKIVFPDISPENRFALDENGSKACLDTIYFLVRNEKRKDYEDRYLLALLNSRFLDYAFGSMTPKVRGGYRRYKSQYVEKLPIPLADKEKRKELVALVKQITKNKTHRNKINLNLLDYIGKEYKEGNILSDIYQPVENISDKTVSNTSADKEKLQVGSVETERSNNDVTLLVSARYKPENESAYETDRYGYTETELFPAMEFHNLSEAEATLIEEFIPVAVDEAGGFANFRKKATKTNSLVDRLKKLTLPKVSDVEDDLKKFIEQKERAEELDEKIEETEEEINHIVYDLYDLTEEEIEVVEEAVVE